jgi:ribosomal protein L22
VATPETQREVRAEAKYVRGSAQKARLVADAIRGRSVPEARTILAFTTKAVARDIEKVLRSAVTNAEANHGLLGDELVISAVYADEGPTLKRHRPRARGRVGRIFKRTCHITIKLVQGAPVQAPKPKQAAVAASEEQPAAEKPKRTRKKKEAVA